MLLLRLPHLPQPMSSSWNTNWDPNTPPQQLYFPQPGTNANTLASANGDVETWYDPQNMSGVNWHQWPLQSGHDARLVEGWMHQNPAMGGNMHQAVGTRHTPVVTTQYPGTGITGVRVRIGTLNTRTLQRRGLTVSGRGTVHVKPDSERPDGKDQGYWEARGAERAAAHGLTGIWHKHEGSGIHIPPRTERTNVVVCQKIDAKEPKKKMSTAAKATRRSANVDFRVRDPSQSPIGFLLNARMVVKS
ncbi:hypothetical protein F5887DRAFT_1190494 [Amanita rubescens]|nr:hypothetical protein F5887DRAFT_1190494 [Amanita rubescens]